jgi:peptidoglycan/xylan/chitin deacetylase (PgdA/CDA1 family)
MLRAIAKTGVAAMLGWTGADRALSSWAGTAKLPLILGYHAVVEDVRAHVGRAIAPNLISVEMLERQLEWVCRHYRVMTLDDLGAQLERGEPFDRPCAAVTFDDGYVGVYRYALPLLQRMGIPAGVFIVTELTGRAELQLYDKLYLVLETVLPLLGHSEKRLRQLLESKNLSLGQPGPDRRLDAFQTMRRLLSTHGQKKLRRIIEALETVSTIREADYPDMQVMDWEMVRTMDACGVTIGSHTQTHALLTEESVERAANQTVGSMATLKDRLKRPIRHFAYPDGRFNAAVVSAVAAAGYRYGYGTCLRRDPRHPNLTIPRTLLWERSCLDAGGRFSPALMRCHAYRLYDLWARCEHNHGASTAAVSPAASRRPEARQRQHA